MIQSKAITVAVAVALPVVFVLAQEKESNPTTRAEQKIFSSAELPWRNAATLPPGAQMVVLDGDPAKPGLFTARLKMPAGYKIPPHTHPTPERVTVISGTAYLGFGDKFDERAGRELKTGDFAVIPAGVPHFAWSRAEAVLQLHTEGPFQRTFINPADDPAEGKN
ncbi:MAG: cupin domain-containing protein [Verrucomicrobiaceae bacterium]|nr:cupin domain-containing protein [Verrucomicrobiaceae bacterium]